MRLRCLVAALALLSAFASDSWGQSKKSPTKSQQEQTKSQEQKAAPDQRGTDQFPLVVQPLPTKKNAEIAEKEKREADEKTNSDLWTWIFSLLTIAALFGQLAVFIAQAYFLWGTVEATAAAANAAVDATDLARQEFIATHRPRIIVYGMEVQLLGDTETQRKVHFRYVNAGDTDAFVTSIHSRVLWHSKDMIEGGTELHRHDVIKEPVFVPSGNNGLAITPDGIDYINLVRSGRAGHDTAYCVGVVVYRDTNSIERRTGFCRRYDSERERWLKVADADYEYEY
jgi:hypothetical protein